MPNGINMKKSHIGYACFSIDGIQLVFYSAKERPKVRYIMSTIYIIYVIYLAKFFI